MTVKESQAVRQKKGSAVQQHEDAALKTSMQFLQRSYCLILISKEMWLRLHRRN